MAINFKVGDIEVRCDTPSEAAALLLALKTAQPAPCAINGQEPKKGGFAAIWETLDSEQRQFLTAIASANPGSINTDALAAKLNLDTNRLGWVRRKVKAVATANRTDLSKYIGLDKVQVDGRLKTAYRAKEKLLTELAANGIHVKRDDPRPAVNLDDI